MGFVKTREEIARIEAPLRRPRFTSAQMLSVDFLTDPEWVAAVLPPPLRPAATPRLTAMVGRWQSNCVGDYDGGALYVSARHGEVEGDYVLGMWMSSDTAMIVGRDVFGEPKKRGTAQVHRHGDRLTGWCERDGVKLLQLDVELQTHHGPTEAGGVNFNFKARPAADGVGLQEDAILTVCRFANVLSANSEGRGSVRLTGTAHDPLDEVVVGEIVRGAYVEGDLISSCEQAATVPADVFLPYHHGRHDDWSALDTERGSLLHA